MRIRKLFGLLCRSQSSQMELDGNSFVLLRRSQSSQPTSLMMELDGTKNGMAFEKVNEIDIFIKRNSAGVMIFMMNLERKILLLRKFQR